MTFATYRFQLHAGFRFDDVRSLTDYLRALGVSTIYTSPILQARQGSTHGYDVIDPTRLNRELGSEEDFRALTEAAGAAGLELLVDIVPNHMAASAQSPWWSDVLRQGPESPYASYFDVDWSSEDVRDNLSDKVLLPILGRPYGEVLEDQELRIVFEEGAFFVRYYERRLPLNFASYVRILHATRERLSKTGAHETSNAIEPLILILDEWGQHETEPPAAEEIQAMRHRIASLANGSSSFRTALDHVLRILNGKRGDPESFDELDTILEEQSYSLSFWRNAAEEINYRRFFDITDLISIRVSDPAVFDATHQFVLELVATGAIRGLRLDHIDGLLDPAGYLEMLGDRLERIAPDTLVVSEKILGEDEVMPENFRYRGTTGYELAGAIDRVLVSVEGFRKLDRGFAEISGLDGFAPVARNAKIQVIRELFRGELNNFARRFAHLTANDRHAKDLPPSTLEEALVQLIASLPVYRTYIRDHEILDRDLEILDRTVAEAKQHLAEDSAIAAIEFLHKVLRLDTDDRSQRREWLRFAMRLQQFTGPVTAKGVEDTALYVYTPLVSLNEVGSEPVIPDDPIAPFHELNRRRLSITPKTLSATSTHDTKRGEDTRCRIDVLSEIPSEWLSLYSIWSSRHGSIEVGERVAPSEAEKWFLLQSIVGTWPLLEEDQEAYPARIAEYVPKALREAKIHSHWTTINEDWERATIDWIGGVIEDSAFRREMEELQKVVAFHGMVNSLSMTVLKITSPGIPDLYQGSEMWNLSLVDPDNRRPVDYERRRQALVEIESGAADHSGLEALMASLREEWIDGRIKLFTTWRALAARRSQAELFNAGDYLPLRVEGAYGSHVIAFARRSGDRWAVTVVPVRSATLCRTEPRFPEGDTVWGDTTVVLPADAPSSWQSAITGDQIDSDREPKRLPVRELLARFPVAILTSTNIS